MPHRHLRLNTFKSIIRQCSKNVFVCYCSKVFDEQKGEKHTLFTFITYLRNTHYIRSNRTLKSDQYHDSAITHIVLYTADSQWPMSTLQQF